MTTEMGPSLKESSLREETEYYMVVPPKYYEDTSD